MAKRRSDTQTDITNLLGRVGAGDEAARERLVSVLYDELRAIAGARIGPAQHTLGVTALVSEAYVKLFDRMPLEWNDRRHFFRVASMAMRQILIDRARAKLSQRAGGGQVHVEAHSGIESNERQRAEELMDVERALRDLEARHERLAHVVELRFFGGLTFDEIGEVLEIGTRTAKRDWSRARAMLHARLAGGDGEPS